jgi:hypothetical protein
MVGRLAFCFHPDGYRPEAIRERKPADISPDFWNHLATLEARPSFPRFSPPCTTTLARLRPSATPPHSLSGKEPPPRPHVALVPPPPAEAPRTMPRLAPITPILREPTVPSSRRARRSPWTRAAASQGSGPHCISSRECPRRGLEAARLLAQLPALMRPPVLRQILFSPSWNGSQKVSKFF